MANIPVNATGIVSTTSVTGSYAGFTVVSGSATFTGAKDANNIALTTPWVVPAGFTVANAAITFSALIDANGNNLGALNFPAGVTGPLCVTSASFTGGPAIFYS